MAKITGTTRAILDLLEVQTALEVSAQTGGMNSEWAAKLALKVEAARNLLQHTILEAKRILDEGHSP